MATIQALIWDMGGVILRTEDMTPRSQLAAHYGITLTDLEKMVFESPTGMAATVGQIPEEQHWQAVFNALNVRESDHTGFQEQFWGGDRIDESLVTWIAELRALYKVSLLSNAWSDMRSSFGRRYHFLHVFDDIIFSAEVNLAKPDHAIYQLAASRLKVGINTCVFIDDVAKNVEAVRSAGMRAIQFKNTPQVRQDLEQLLYDTGRQ
jgi:epoxide hydrolase-like predicted phosphatase